MNSQKSITKPLVSICIPTYNGETTIKETLDSILRQITSEFEIIISDDRSNDSTFVLAKEYSNKYPALKVYQNEKNKGMDGNFHLSIKYATGEYIWFSGQDDIFEDGAIQKVLSVITENPDVDFIFMNYMQKSDDLKKIITARMLKIDNDVKCVNYEEFLNVTGLENLPTFLPAYVLRKNLWGKIDKKKYYGTQYIQVGVLLSLLKRMKAYIVSDTFISGRIPDVGWQNSAIKLLDNFSGNFEVIQDAVLSKNIEISSSIYNRFYLSRKLMALSLVLRARKENRQIKDKIKTRLTKTKLCSPRLIDFIYSNISPSLVKYLKIDVLVLILFKLYQWKNQLLKVIQ